MHLQPFSYYSPATLPEFFKIIQRPRFKRYVVMAGGTDVLVKLKHRLIHPSHVISLKNIQQLKKIEQKGQYIFIGSSASLQQVRESALVQSFFPALAQAASKVATPQIRNMGTIGGNICLDTRCLYYNQPEWACSFPPCFKRGGNRCHVVKKGSRCYAVFCADTPPVLLSLDALLVIAGPAVKKEIPISEFYQDDGLVCIKLKPDELVVGIKISIDSTVFNTYKRFSIRGAIDFPVLGAAISLSKTSNGKSLRPIISATGVQSNPIRFESLKKIPIDQSTDEKKINKLIADGIEGIRFDHHQGLRPGYRREVLKLLILQGLKECIRAGDNRNETIS